MSNEDVMPEFHLPFIYSLPIYRLLLTLGPFSAHHMLCCLVACFHCSLHACVCSQCLSTTCQSHCQLGRPLAHWRWACHVLQVLSRLHCHGLGFISWAGWTEQGGLFFFGQVTISCFGLLDSFVNKDFLFIPAEHHLCKYTERVHRDRMAREDKPESESVTLRCEAESLKGKNTCL